MILKVCMLTTSFPRFTGDSAGTFIYSLAFLLSQKGIRLEIIAPHDPGSRFFEKWGNIHIHRFPYFFPLKYQRLCYRDGLLNNLRNSRLAAVQVPFFVLAEFLYLLWIIKKTKTDLVHAHWSVPQGFLSILAKYVLKIPCVISLHGSDVFGLRHPIFKTLNKLVIRHADACTANSLATAKTAQATGASGNLKIVPMGVDPRGFQKSAEADELKKKHQLDAEVILSVGRLIDLKGTEYLIKALPAVLLRFPRAKALIIGSGPRKNQLLDLAKNLRLEENIVFIDQIPHVELIEYYAVADVFVLPSIINPKGETEGFGVVLLEAMACGLPVIGSDVGGIPDIIENGETGLLARQKDPQHLSHQLLRVLSDADLKEKLVGNARKLIETRFSWEIVAGRFIEIYRAALQGN